MILVPISKARNRGRYGFLNGEDKGFVPIGEPTETAYGGYEHFSYCVFFQEYIDKYCEPIDPPKFEKGDAYGSHIIKDILKFDGVDWLVELEDCLNDYRPKYWSPKKEIPENQSWVKPGTKYTYKNGTSQTWFIPEFFNFDSKYWVGRGGDKSGIEVGHSEWMNLESQWVEVKEEEHGKDESGLSSKVITSKCETFKDIKMASYSLWEKTSITINPNDQRWVGKKLTSNYYEKGCWVVVKYVGEKLLVLDECSKEGLVLENVFGMESDYNWYLAPGETHPDDEDNLNKCVSSF